MSGFQVSRRTVLKAIGAAGALSAAPALLTACGSGGNSAPTSGGGAAPLPTYIPFDGPKPDLPGGSEAVSDVYLRYPQQLKQTTSGRPGDGSSVRLLLSTTAPPPAPLGQNQWWQAVNDNLGVKLELNLTPSSQYAEKFAVVMAGGDLPDLMFIDAFAFPPRFDQFVQTQCQDLSEYLAGDAIKKYPNLANLPTYAWQAQGQFGGGIFSVPVVRSLISNSLMVNRTLLAGAGAKETWTREEFAAAMKNLSSSKRWGLRYNSFWHNATHASAHGAPNYWALNGGEFTSMYTTDRFRASLEFAHQLWQDGIYHPDSLSLTPPDAQTLFVNQTLAGNPDGLTAVFGGAGLASRIGDKFELDFARPYQVPGAQPAWFTGAGAFGRILLKKAPKQRIEMLLRVLDYLAAPFGTKEQELIRYGVEGVHFTRGDSGVPMATDAAKAQDPGLKPISGGLPPVEGWNSPEAARKMHTWQSGLAKSALKDPTKSNGLRSDTASRTGATLDTLINDAVNAVVTGQKPMSHWDDTVKKWRNQGGDKIAGEYAKAHK